MKLQSKKKYLLFPFLLLFSVNVYAETYLCTVDSNVQVKEDNKVKKITDKVKNEIYKLKIITTKKN